MSSVSVSGFYEEDEPVVPTEVAGPPRPPDYYAQRMESEANIPGIETQDAGLQAFGPALNQYPTEAMVERDIQLDQEDKESRIARMTAKAENLDSSFNLDGTEVSELIDKQDANIQSLLYLADNDEQFVNALETAFGEGNVRMIKDDAPQRFAFSTRNYISVKREDGSFTPFMPATATPTDYMERYVPGIVAETGAALALVPAAMATSAGIATIPGVGPILAPIMFAYTLYSGGKGVEMGRQYLQDTLDLNDEETLQFENWMQTANQIFTPLSGVLSESAGTGGASRELMGGLELIFGGPLGLMDKMKLAIGNLRSKGSIKPDVYESSVRAQETVAETLPGGELDVGVPLIPLMLQQVSPGKIINRIAALTEQTSLAIGLKTREQMQSLVSYLTKYKDNIGEGNFDSFRNALTGIGETLQTIRNTPGNVRPDLSQIGENLNSLDKLFRELRALESRGLYANVFDKLKNSKYNLDDIRAQIPEEIKTLLPQTPVVRDPEEKAALISGARTPEERGQRMFDNLAESLLLLGKFDDKTGTRFLSRQQVPAAVKQFMEENPGIKIESKNIDSPAEILQMYASRFGELSYEIYSKAGTQPNPRLYNASKDMRDALLELIGKPVDPVEGIAEELAEANTFYRNTIKTLDTPLQTEARIKTMQGGTDDPSELAEALTTMPGGKGRSQAAATTMQNINAQEAYVRENISKITTDKNFTGATELKEAFASVISSKLRRSLPTMQSDKESSTSVVDFLESFGPRQLEALGITKEIEQVIRNDAEYIARIQYGGTIEQVAVMPPNTKIAEVVEMALAGDSKDIRIALNELTAPIRRASGTEAKNKVRENLRAGVLNYIISKESGVLVEATKRSVYADAGQITVNADNLINVLDKINKSGLYGEVLTQQDKKVFDALSEYAAVINTKGADAGSALAGAQIIGNMFTVDPAKFIAGLARLGSQARIARLMANDEFVKAITGTGKPMTQAERLKTMFFGKGAIGSAIAKVSMETYRETDAEQTNRMLEESRQSSQTVDDFYAN